MQTEILPGASVMSDNGTMGSVERVEKDSSSGELRSILVRPGRADYLLRVPANLVRVANEGRVEIVEGSRLDDLEREALESGRLPPMGSHITDAGPADDSATRETPSPEQVTGHQAGMPLEYDGPSTG
jgi:hypothetical protein